MGETTDQIEKEIAQERIELGRNLDELQQRVKSATDWRAQLNRRPFAMLGLAFGTGLILSSLIGPRPERRQRRIGSGVSRWR